MFQFINASCELIRYFPYSDSEMFTTDVFLEFDRDSEMGKDIEETLFHFRNEPKKMIDNKAGYLIRNYNGKALGFFCKDSKIYVGTLSAKLIVNDKVDWIKFTI